MKQLKKSEFLRMVLDAGMSLNSDARIRNNPHDDSFRKYLAFLKMEERGLCSKNHGYVVGKGYTKECPIADAIVFLSYYLCNSELISMKDAMACAMILQEYNEAAWEAYEPLLKEHQELMQQALACLHAVAESNADRAGLRH